MKCVTGDLVGVAEVYVGALGLRLQKNQLSLGHVHFQDDVLKDIHPDDGNSCLRISNVSRDELAPIDEASDLHGTRDNMRSSRAT